jgi:hypothetical protein
MTSDVLVKRLRDSTLMWAAENRRAMDEAERLERQAMTNTDNTDDMVRELKRRVDAKEAELAQDRELLARAEAQRQTLARDAKAAQDAAHKEAVAACKARIADLLDRKLALVEHAERLCRELAGVREEIVRTGAEMRAECGRLDAASAAPSDLDVIRRMSLRESKLMSKVPGGPHRYGAITLPSASFGLVPDALDWRADEQRHHRGVIALVQEG